MSTDKPLVNLDFGLSQLGGNQELLDKMLGKFVNEFESSANEIAQQIQSEQFDDAKIRVHTTKGISGNLGLQALYQLATELDAQLREKACKEALLASYAAVLSDTCQEIRRVCVTKPKSVALVDTEIDSNSGKASLLSKLERNEFIDDDTLLELVSSLKLSDDVAQTLLIHIEELRYKDAIALLNT